MNYIYGEESEVKGSAVENQCLRTTHPGALCDMYDMHDGAVCVSPTSTHPGAPHDVDDHLRRTARYNARPASASVTPGASRAPQDTS